MILSTVQPAVAVLYANADHWIHASSLDHCLASSEKLLTAAGYSMQNNESKDRVPGYYRDAMHEWQSVQTGPWMPAANGRGDSWLTKEKIVASWDLKAEDLIAAGFWSTGTCLVAENLIAAGFWSMGDGSEESGRRRTVATSRDEDWTAAAERRLRVLGWLMAPRDDEVWKALAEASEAAAASAGNEGYGDDEVWRAWMSGKGSGLGWVAK
jgi:hypothetical protein